MDDRIFYIEHVLIWQFNASAAPIGKIVHNSDDYLDKHSDQDNAKQYKTEHEPGQIASTERKKDYPKDDIPKEPFH